MSKSYNAKIIMEDSDHGVAVVRVISDKCFYNVAFGPEITGGQIIGPGVNEEIELEDDAITDDIETNAILVVIEFEHKGVRLEIH